MNKKLTKISIIGAGSVGAATAFSLAISGMVEELVLVDINNAKAEGEAMDIAHGAEFIRPINVRAGQYEDTKDSDIVVVTAGLPQKPGETRLELVNKNVSIFKEMIPDIAKYSPEAILLIVANPVDILSYVAYELSGFPKERVIGSGTTLDTTRLKYEIGKAYNVDPRNVNSYILGEHGDTEFVTWSLTNIQSIGIEEYAQKLGYKYDEEFRNVIHKNVVRAAYEVINRKGATFYAIALSITRIVEAILGDERSVLPLSTYVNDYYGVSDVYIGVPTIIGRNGVEKMVKVSLCDSEIEKFKNSAETLKGILKDVTSKMICCL